MTRVADVMTPGVETTTSSEALRDAARTMRKGDFGAMPVVDDGRLVGMLTDRDIVVRAVAEGLDPMSARVGDVASPSPVAVAPDQDLDEAMELMAEYRVRRLPVVDGERLVGVVSQADVALEANEKKTGSVVQEISEPSSVPRET
ncbi:CBS domain-containing protein [Gaiella sp.]|jgi:CBS domain-containing protein|uniref:CBS domain-containing protein n=1 Tax=Gaiella sp. TaxID=2663207 RepID=UPI002CAF3098|nr:CBS domain-containing protein [Gaiella sp.]HWO79943.1 CBS domain-containing protein [Gaiella sp.]